MINRISNLIKLGPNTKTCFVKWSESKETENNIGDALNPFLFEKIFGKVPHNIKYSINSGIFPVYSFIGSVLDNSGVRNLQVLGSGFRNEKSTLNIKPRKVHACRGPLTRKKLMDLGVDDVPEVYGDPAILLPKCFDIKAEKKYEMGLIPHYVDQGLTSVEIYKNQENVKYIDVLSNMTEFISGIKSCEFTISSSLHGVILSQAYGIPSVWVKFSNKVGGGNFKFRDYYNSLEMEIAPVELNDTNLCIEDLKKSAVLPDLSNLTEKLSQTFQNLKV